MRKESGFAPHEVSYANAQGLMQLIPSAGHETARALGVPFFVLPVASPACPLGAPSPH